MTVRDDLYNNIQRAMMHMDPQSRYVILCNPMDYEVVKRTDINMPIRLADYVEQGTVCLINKYELERFLPDDL